MNTKTSLGLVLIGFIIWLTGTLLFHEFGLYFFECSAVEYWFNLISTGVLCAGVSGGLMKWWRIPEKDWWKGAICIALPGMLGEIPILYGFQELMSNMHPETAGRYAAFLFGGYGLLISFAGLVSIKANSVFVADE